MKNDEDPEDELLDRLDAGAPPADEQEAAARAPYQRLRDQVRALAPEEPPAGWREALDARIRTARAAQIARRRRFYAAAGGGVALAAALLVFVVARRAPEPPKLTLDVDVREDPTRHRRSLASVGDTLHAEARIAYPNTEIRIYAGLRMVARCPGHEGCRNDGRTISIDLRLSTPDIYRVVAFGHTHAIYAPGNSFEGDLTAADAAGVDVKRGEPVSVAP